MIFVLRFLGREVLGFVVDISKIVLSMCLGASRCSRTAGVPFFYLDFCFFGRPMGMSDRLQLGDLSSGPKSYSTTISESEASGAATIFRRIDSCSVARVCLLPLQPRSC